MSLSEEKLQQIVELYSRDELTLSKAFSDGGTEPLWARFERAAINQIDNGDATGSRYAIWANTVRDNIHEGLRCMENGNPEEAEKYLIRAINSLSAFSEVQLHLC